MRRRTIAPFLRLAKRRPGRRLPGDDQLEVSERNPTPTRPPGRITATYLPTLTGGSTFWAGTASASVILKPPGADESPTACHTVTGEISR